MFGQQGVSTSSRKSVTSPNAVGGGRMEPSATFGRGHMGCNVTGRIVVVLLVELRL